MGEDEGMGGLGCFRPLKKLKKNNVDKEGPPSSRPPARAGGPGGAAPRKKEKDGKKSPKVPSLDCLDWLAPMETIDAL